MIIQSLAAAILFLSPLALAEQDIFNTQIRPIFHSRCIQCHSCYNAPCQLNLSSIEGLNRGLVQGFEVYESKRLRAVEPSRLGIDRKNTEEWRKFSLRHKFQPVVPDIGFNSPSMIQLSTAHKAANGDLPIDDLSDFKHLAAENSRTCPDSAAKLQAFLGKRPEAGMPYGLPPLSDGELNLINQWTQMGSPRPEEDRTIPEDELSSVRKIESFLNAFTSSDSEEAKRQNLVSRYLYEHLFLAHIHVRDEKAPQTFYRLVRSRSECQENVDEIPTRRPWSDPEEKYFYCLKKDPSLLVHKTHMPYLVDEARINRWRALFLSDPWAVSFKPGFFDRFRTKKGWAQDIAPRGDQEASNPLLVFRDIPVQARYQFLLDDARYHVDTFIRGPVCKGNTAVNSIDEQFYVFFVRPDSDLLARNKEFHQNAIPLHLLPAHKGSEQVGGILVGRKIREARNKYRELRNRFYSAEFPKGYAIDDVWNGSEPADQAYRFPNKNAALTVMRNYDSASVQNGLVGATPKTSFLLDYSLFERLVYVLVTGFDVYGDVSHQMHTRLYMAYLRMEAEENYLNLFPSNVREPMRKSWYISAKGITERIGRTVNALLLRERDKMSRLFPLLGLENPTRVESPVFDTEKFYQAEADSQEEALRSYRRRVNSQIRIHLGSALDTKTELNPDKPLATSADSVAIGPVESTAQFEAEFAKLTDLKALRSPWVLKMPNLSYILLESGRDSEIYTMIRNKEHYNIAWIFGEGGRRNRAADSMVLYKGVLGSYPNHFFVVPLNRARSFLQKMAKINDQATYEAWIREFGNPRNGPGSERFWAGSDKLHREFRRLYPKEFGAFDYNRYGMDYRYHNDESDPEEFTVNLPQGEADLYKDSFGDNE